MLVAVGASSLSMSGTMVVKGYSMDLFNYCNTPSSTFALVSACYCVHSVTPQSFLDLTPPPGANFAGLWNE